MPEFSSRDIHRFLGSVSDRTIVELMNLDAALEDLELAALRLAKEDDAISEARKPLTGGAARIFDIAKRDPLYVEELERERGSIS